MKINNKIIITIADFKRYFDLEQFWNVRRQFIRDMHPDKVCYWKDEDKYLFQDIKTWIEMENSGNTSSDVRKKGLEGLSTFIGKNVTEKDFLIALGASDFNADIIYVQSGSSLKLPGKKVMTEEEAVEYTKDTGKKERLHKIEIKGDDEEPVAILINGIEMYQLPYGECVYITEIDGQFIRTLPSHLNMGGIYLDLVNIPNEFTSILHVTRYISGKKEYTLENITQMKFAHGTFISNSDKYFTILN